MGCNLGFRSQCSGSSLRRLNAIRFREYHIRVTLHLVPVGANLSRNFSYILQRHASQVIFSPAPLKRVGTNVRLPFLMFCRVNQQALDHLGMQGNVNTSYMGSSLDPTHKTVAFYSMDKQDARRSTSTVSLEYLHVCNGGIGTAWRTSRHPSFRI